MEKNLSGKGSSLADVGSPEARARLGELVPGHDPEVAHLLVLLTRLARRNDAVLAELAAPHGLLPSETSVLVSLLWAGPPHQLRPSVLADALLQTSGGMTATLRRLADAGFVARVPDPADGRVLLAALTPAGESAARAALADQVAHWEAALGGLAPERRRQLRAAVRTLLEALEPPPPSPA